MAKTACPYCGSTGRPRRTDVATGLGPVAKTRKRRCSWPGHVWR